MYSIIGILFQEVFYGPADVRLGHVFLHGCAEGYIRRGGVIYLAETGRTKYFFVGYLAGYQNDRNTCLAGFVQYACRNFPHRSLPVGAALTCNDQVCSLYLVPKSVGFQQQADARTEFGVQKGSQCTAQSSCRSCAG